MLMPEQDQVRISPSNFVPGVRANGAWPFVVAVAVIGLLLLVRETEKARQSPSRENLPGLVWDESHSERTWPTASSLTSRLGTSWTSSLMALRSPGSSPTTRVTSRAWTRRFQSRKDVATASGMRHLASVMNSTSVFPV